MSPSWSPTRGVYGPSLSQPGWGPSLPLRTLGHSFWLRLARAAGAVEAVHAQAPEAAAPRAGRGAPCGCNSRNDGKARLRFTRGGQSGTWRRSPSESSAVTAVNPPPLKDGPGEQKRVGRHFFLVESAMRACGGYGSQAQHHCVVVAGQGSSAARNLHVPPAGSDQTNW
jgi:hypothetical protein